MSCQRGFTLLELAVVMVTVLILVGLIIPIPAMNCSICTVRRVENINRVRGIHQSLVLWSADNNGFYPGLNTNGQPVDLTVEARFQVLLEGNYVTPMYIISPATS